MTERQEKFVNEYARHSNGSKAAIAAGYSVKGAHVAANRLLKNGTVKAALAALRAPVVHETRMTLESHLDTLAELRDAAVAAGQMSAAVSAEVARGKAAGLVVDLIRMKDPAEQNDDELEAAALTARRKLKLA